MIIQNSTTVTVSSLIDTKTKQQRTLGGGAAEYIDKGRNKGYLPAPKYGAFWVDEVRNIHRDASYNFEFL